MIQYTRWLGTSCYLVGMMLTSFNIFPLNLIFGLLGGVLWTIVGFDYKDKALVTVEVASALIYGIGLVRWLII